MRLAELARAAMFALVAPASAGGALALAPLLPFFGILSWRPSLAWPTLRRPPIYLVLLALFIVWIGVTALWSPSPSNALIVWLQFAAMIAGGLMFVCAAHADEAALRLTRAAAIAALTVLASLLAIEAVSGMAMNHAANPSQEDWQLAGNPGRGVVVLVCSIWALLGMLASRRQWALATLTLAAMGTLAFQFGQAANIAAFVIGALAFAGGWLAPRLAILATSGITAAWLLLAPFLSPVLFSAASVEWPFSWAHRIAIWRYVCARVLENPILGWGLDSSRADEETTIVLGKRTSAIPLHPHSASLQIWLETGGVGAALAAAAIVAGGVSLARAWGAHRAGAAAACGGIAAVSVIANIGYGIWQSWWHAAILLAAAAISGLALRKTPAR